MHFGGKARVKGIIRPIHLGHSISLQFNMIPKYKLWAREYANQPLWLGKSQAQKLFYNLKIKSRQLKVV